VALMTGIIVAGWIGASALAEGTQDLGDEGVAVSLVGVVLLAAGLTLLGYGLGLLVRNSALAICILLLWPLVVEGIIAGLLSVAGWEGLQRWLPYQAGFNLIHVEHTDDTLGRTAGGLWFFLWVAVITGFGVWSANRRDA
jgi:ABC-2 type transport system permease protein